MADVVAGRAYVKFGADFSQLDIAFRQVSARLDKLKSKVAKTSSSLQNVGSSITGLGARLALPFVTAGIAGARFADQMSTVKGTVSNLTDDGFKKLNDKAKELGSTTSFSASQVSSAMVILARQGKNANEILGAIGPTLDSARAGGVELAESAELIGDTGKVFGQNFGEVADIIAKTATSSSQGFFEIQEAMKFVSGEAVDLGISLQDTGVLLAILANRGLKSTIAATALNQAFNKLSSNNVQEKLKDAFNIDVSTASGEFRGMIPIVTDLKRALAGFTPVARKAFLQETFDSRGARAISRLMAETGPEIKRVQAEIAKFAGSASRLAKIMDDNLGGSFRNALSAVEGVAIAVTEALTPSLREIFGLVSSVSRSIKEFTESNHSLISSVVPLVGWVGSLGLSFTALGLAGKIASIGIGLATTGLSIFKALAKGTIIVLSFLRTTLISIGTIGGVAFLPLLLKIGLVAGAVAGLLYSLGLFDDEMKDATGSSGKATTALEGTEGATNGMTDAVKKAEAEAKKFQKQLDKAEGKFDKLSGSIGDAKDGLGGLRTDMEKGLPKLTVSLDFEYDFRKAFSEIKARLEGIAKLGIESGFEAPAVLSIFESYNERLRGSQGADILKNVASGGIIDPQTLVSAILDGVISEKDFKKAESQGIRRQASINVAEQSRFLKSLKEDDVERELGEFYEKVISQGYITADQALDGINRGFFESISQAQLFLKDALQQRKDDIAFEKSQEEIQTERADIMGTFSGRGVFGASNSNPVVNEQKKTNKALGFIIKNTEPVTEYRGIRLA